jgi:hypothetical protein
MLYIKLGEGRTWEVKRLKRAMALLFVKNEELNWARLFDWDQTAEAPEVGCKDPRQKCMGGERLSRGNLDQSKGEKL